MHQEQRPPQAHAPAETEKQRKARIRQEIAEKCARLKNKRDPVDQSNVMIGTAKVLRHIAKLRAAGVGVKTIALRAGIARGTVLAILGHGNGKKHKTSRRTRTETAEAILSVTVEHARGRARIDGTVTWKLLDDMLGRGFTKTWIAQQLGFKTKSLQIYRGTVTAENARKVRELHARFVGQYPPTRTGRWKYTPPPAPRPKAAPPNPSGRNQHAPAETPLSKRDPAIAERWAQLRFGATS